MISGCRYERAIKQSLNKEFDNQSSVHKYIAAIIASYSHKTLVRPGSYLLAPTYHFFVVSDVLSAHWCKGFFCPPQIELSVGTDIGTHLGQGMASFRHFYTPNIACRSVTQRKRIFSPFVRPCVRIRTRKFLLESKRRYEQMPHSPTIFT